MTKAPSGELRTRSGSGKHLVQYYTIRTTETLSTGRLNLEETASLRHLALNVASHHHHILQRCGLMYACAPL